MERRVVKLYPCPICKHVVMEHPLWKHCNDCYKKQKRHGQKYITLLEKQSGVCALCGRKDKNRSLALDHNHRTGKVRGLLCFYCNVMLGFARENSETLFRAIQYLK